MKRIITVKKNKLKLKMKLCFLFGKSIQMLDKKLLSTMILIHKSKEGKKEDYFVIVDSLLSFKFSQERHYSSFDEMFENVCDLAYDVSNFLSSGGANIKTYLNDYEVVFDN